MVVVLKHLVLVFAVVEAQTLDHAALSVGGLMGYPSSKTHIGDRTDSFADYVDGSYESAGLLAIEHFNEKNDAIVKEISTLDETCKFQFAKTNRLVLPSNDVKGAIERTWQLTMEKGPKAILGPQSAEIMKAIDPIAKAFNVPILNHFFEDDSPVSVTMTLSRLQRAKAMVDYLRRPLLKTEAIAMMYQENTNEEEFALEVKKFGDKSHLDVVLFPLTASSSVADVLRAVQESRIGTIYIGLDAQTGVLEETSRRMESISLLSDDFVYIISPETYSSNMFSTEPSVIDLFRGALVFDRLDPYQRESDSFLSSWRDSYGRREDEYPANGASFVYDAIMAMAFAVCRSPKSVIEGLKQTSFEGASGAVQFTTSDDNKVIRDQHGVFVGSFNVRMKQLDDSSKQFLRQRLTAVYSGTMGWQTIEGSRHIYRSGLPYPPTKTIKKHEQHDIIQEVGLILIVIACFVCASTGFLIFVYKKEAAIRRTQPFYLCGICFGCLLSCGAVALLPTKSAIRYESFLCMGMPWLFAVGMVMTSSAMFTKAWRIHQATRLHRVRRPSGSAVFTAPLLIAVFILLIWSLVDPLVWNVGDNERLGVCKGNHDTFFNAAIGFVLAYMEVFTLLFAWRTMNKNVPQEFQDNAAIVFSQCFRVYTLFLGSIAYVLGLSDRPTSASFFVWNVLLGLTVSLAPVVVVVLPKLIHGIRTRVFGSESLFKNAELKNSETTGEGTKTGSSETNTTSSLRNLLPPSIIIEDPEEGSQGKDSYFNRS